MQKLLFIVFLKLKEFAKIITEIIFFRHDSNGNVVFNESKIIEQKIEIIEEKDNTKDYVILSPTRTTSNLKSSTTTNVNPTTTLRTISADQLMSADLVVIGALTDADELRCASGMN